MNSPTSLSFEPRSGPPACAKAGGTGEGVMVLQIVWNRFSVRRTGRASYVSVRLPLLVRLPHPVLKPRHGTLDSFS
jgi:hypothetical protein